MLRRLVLAALLALPAACNAADYTITLRNRSGVALVPYPVVTTPPPPHREADAANTLTNNTEALLEPTGFNPLFYDGTSQKGFTMQFALDDDPPAILVRFFDYPVPPGQAGANPATQPSLLEQQLYAPTELDLIFTFRGRDANGDIQFDFQES